jgi:hypothetical protein
MNFQFCEILPLNKYILQRSEGGKIRAACVYAYVWLSSRVTNSSGPPPPPPPPWVWLHRPEVGGASQPHPRVKMSESSIIIR